MKYGIDRFRLKICSWRFMLLICLYLFLLWLPSREDFTLAHADTSVAFYIWQIPHTKVGLTVVFITLSNLFVGADFYHQLNNRASNLIRHRIGTSTYLKAELFLAALQSFTIAFIANLLFLSIISTKFNLYLKPDSFRNYTIIQGTTLITEKNYYLIYFYWIIKVSLLNAFFGSFNFIVSLVSQTSLMVLVSSILTYLVFRTLALFISFPEILDLEKIYSIIRSKDSLQMDSEAISDLLLSLGWGVLWLGLLLVLLFYLGMSIFRKNHLGEE